jgi:saccharopine dehydrogenase-like NADP-dependent oxidoreductase
VPSPHEAVIIGSGGIVAEAMLEAAARAHDISQWVAVDREWRPDRRAALAARGVRVVDLDIVEQPEALRELIEPAKLVANFAGPFYRTGPVILQACIDAGTDYLDVCDDSDTTLDLLKLDGEAKRAGVRCLVGMGSSPGVMNLLVRAAVDVLGEAQTVDIAWIVDIQDSTPAQVQHFFHIFGLVDRDGQRKPVARWEELKPRKVQFPSPLHEQTVIELSHPETVTLPRFLPIGQVNNFGGVTPEDALFVGWALARCGADGDETVSVEGEERGIADLAAALYQRYREHASPSPYLGDGLILDVHSAGNGFRFESGDSTNVGEATGIPAAAGILLMLSDRSVASGVIAPECLVPAAFFSMLGKVSRGAGSLKLWRLSSGVPKEQLRIRELLQMQKQA